MVAELACSNWTKKTSVCVSWRGRSEDQNQPADMDGEDVQSADCQDHRPQPAVKRRKTDPQPIGDSKTDPQPISDSEELGGEANFCLGQEHDSAQVRELEGSEWPPDF